MVDVYLSVADVEERLLTTFTTSTSPTLAEIQSLITLAEGDFETQVGIYQTQTGTVDIIDNSQTGVVFLKSLPITAITQLRGGNTNLLNPNWTVVDATDSNSNPNYVIKNGDIGSVYSAQCYDRLEYTYNSGYSYANMPNAIKNIVFLMTYRYIFTKTFIETSGNLSGKTEIIDVDVYREITNGGNPYNGTQALDASINTALINFQKGFKVKLI